MEISRYPAGYTALLTSAKWLLLPTREVVVFGERGKAVTEEMLSVVGQSNLLRTAVLFNPGDNPELLSFAPHLKSLPVADKEATAYVCSNFSCQAPLADPQELKAILGELPE